MKIFNLATLALAATCCVSYAQQPAAPDSNKLQVIIQFDKDKPQLRTLDSVEGTTFRFTTPDGKQMAGDASKCKIFAVQTPEELADGKKLYEARDYKAARKKLAACKKKFATYASLPMNPSRQAALLEIQSAVAMLDFAALGEMYKTFPTKGMPADMKHEMGIYFAANVLSGVKDELSADEAKALEKAATDLLGKLVAKKGDGGKYKPVDVGGSPYGWTKYALGRALAAQLPADQIKGRNISAENRKLASAAVDAFCEAAVSSHGADREIAMDALVRAQGILWAMPGVKEYTNAHPGKMDRKLWKKAPADLQDAAAIAVLLRKVYEYKDANSSVDDAAKLYFNEQEGKK